MRVRDFMNREVETCEPDADLAKAAMIMWRQDCGIVPVVDVTGRVLGVVTDRDICIAAATQHRPPEQLNVSHVMARDVAAASPDEDIETALARMGSHRVRRLPVLDVVGRIEGMLSIADVMVAIHDGAHANTKQLAGPVMNAMQQICARSSGEGQEHLRTLRAVSP